MPKKTPGHLPNYKDVDLCNRSLFKKRAWRIDDGTFLCGISMTADTVNAGIRRYTTCKNCIRAYDRWFEKMRTSDDLIDRTKIAHLVGTNMDPNATEVQ